MPDERLFLLDTHALIWWWLADPNLSDAARTLLERADGSVYVSAVTGLEIALKVRARKLSGLAEMLDGFEEALAGDRLRSLSISHRHAIDAGLLPGTHRDPFDRLIAAQALDEDMTVITCDREIARFGCKVLW